MTIRKKYLGLALAIFVLEVLVATRLAHVRFIRGSVSDFLVVPLICFTIQAFRRVEPATLSVGVFLFACAVEVAQYFHLAEALHLPVGGILFILLGNSFSVMDLLMYFLGGVAAFVVDDRLLKERSAAPG